MTMTTAMSRAKVTAAGLAVATLLGCSNTTAPVTAYDLTVELQKIHVEGDCEDTSGNPGEFAYRMYLDLLTRALDISIHETPAFPTEAGAVSLSEDDSPFVLTGAVVDIPGIPVEDTDRVFLNFNVLEHDPAGPDSRMYFQQQWVPVRPESPGVGWAVLGVSLACMLRFEFQAIWTPAA